MEDCPVCFEPCNTYTKCGHPLCTDCYKGVMRTRNDGCPICRTIMEAEPTRALTDQEKLADYDRMKKAFEKMEQERNKPRAYTVRVFTPTATAVVAPSPTANFERAMAAVQHQPPLVPNPIVGRNHPVHLQQGQVLGDLPFNQRPRLSCIWDGCNRQTRRVCSGCRAVRCCQEHNYCPDCE